MDFRMTNAVQGMPDTGVIVGHAVGTADKMRLDVSMKGANARVTPLTDSAVSMIVTDSGKTITYLDSKKSQFLRVRPAEMVAQAQQMGGMKMDFSETAAKVDSLGAGPAILGHPTSHYRVTTGMTMTISAMGQQQTVKIASSNDAYYATDIKGYLNPFTTLTGGDMAAIFGTSNKDFGDKMKAVQQKAPQGNTVAGVELGHHRGAGTDARHQQCGRSHRHSVGRCRSKSLRGSFQLYCAAIAGYGRILVRSNSAAVTDPLPKQKRRPEMAAFSVFHRLVVRTS